MKRIGLLFVIAVLAAPCLATGQPLRKADPISNSYGQPPPTSAVNNNSTNIRDPRLLLVSTPAADLDSPQGNNVAFASPVAAGDRPNITFNTANTPADSEPSRALPVFQPINAGTPNTGATANNMLVSAPAAAARPVAQNAVTQSYRLRHPAQMFEKNLVEKLGSRFVPVRNVATDNSVAQYRLPVRDGTNIELVIHKQQGTVSVTGSPGMVDASLRIVRLLDVQEAAGGPVARFVPVQQSNVDAARQVANIVNRETLRVAQAAPPVAVEPMPLGLGDDDLIAAGVVGPVQIEIIDAFGTVIIQGSPEDVAIIQGMLRELEALSLENEPVIELIPLWHADSLRVSQLVQTLYQQVYAVRRGAIIMQPLVKPNTILIIGRQESIDAAKELIAKLDTPVIPNASFRIFHLKHAAAEVLGPQIQTSITGLPRSGQQLAPVVSITADFRTNALIVQANPRDMLEVEAMVRQLDVPSGETTTIMRRFPLRNALATELQTVLTNALNSGTTGRGTMLSLGSVDAEGNLMRSSVAYNVGIIADARSNSLIVTAPPETMPLIEALIIQLDQLPAAESRIRVYTLANGNAFDLANLLTNLFGTQAAAAGQVAAVLPGFEEGESTLVGVRFQAEIRTNSIVAIGSEADLAIAEALLLRLDAENLNNRTVFTMRLINTPAEEIAPLLNNYFTAERQFNIQNAASFLPNSPQEQYRMETNVVAEPISNSLIISTTPRFYEQVRQIVKAIDERPLMVAIDVLIAEVTIGRNRERGVEFGLQDSILFSRATPAAAAATAFPGLLFGNPIAGNSNSVGTQGITSLGVGHAAGGGGGFSFSASSESVSILIRALETQNKTQILSRPRLVTLHNRNAAIQVGDRVPYVADSTVTGAGNVTTSTGFVDVGTILDVTPRIMPDGMIAIALYVERSSHTMILLGGTNAPQIRTTNAQTTINAMEGQSVVFAGLISEQRDTTNNSIPGLNRIPIIRHLFEYDQRRYDRTELLIVLTPRIIRTKEDMMILNQQERERMQWCVSDVVRLTGDTGIRRRSDEWFPSEVRHTHGAPLPLHETQLPPDTRIPTPMFPVIETR